MKYLFEKGLKILKDHGIFAFICSNKFIKAKYGEQLRELLLENQLRIYNDFTGVKIFKEAQVDTCIIQIKKDYKNDCEIYVNDEYYMKQNRLNSNSFTFNSPEILNLRDKILKQGILIKDLDIQINYGIKTGYNKAFIIDEATKNRLINEDSKNKEIIKPLLRGRDINKWKFQYKYLYLIHSYDGLKIKEEYPTIYNFLCQFKEKLEKRYDKGQYWYNLRPCSYDDLFEKEKIMYGEIVPEPRFIYDEGKYFMEATGFILNSSTINLKYLISLLNSKLLFWYFKDIGYNLGGNGYRYKKMFIEQIPIKLAKDHIQNKIINNVNELISLNVLLMSNLDIFYLFLTKEIKVQKISKKLEKFYLLNRKEFLTEIKKQKGTFNDEKKVISIFELRLQEINKLYFKINLIESELDKIIYKIYELNDNEIKIIEKELN